MSFSLKRIERILVKELLKMPIAPRAYKESPFTRPHKQLTDVEHKIDPKTPNELCWRCFQNIDNYCMAYLYGSDDQDEYRKGKDALCHLIH